MTAAKQALPFDLAVSSPKEGTGVGSAKWFQPSQLLKKITVDLLQRQQGFGAHHQGMLPARKPVIGQAIEPLMQGGHLGGLNGESAGGGVTAKALQQISTGLQRGIHRKTLRGPHR